MKKTDKMSVEVELASSVGAKENIRDTTITNRLRVRLRQLHKQLRDKAESLRLDMEHLLIRLDSDDPFINNCGEIQGRGPSIDMICAEIGALEKALREVERPA